MIYLGLYVYHMSLHNDVTVKEQTKLLSLIHNMSQVSRIMFGSPYMIQS